MNPPPLPTAGPSPESLEQIRLGQRWITVAILLDFIVLAVVFGAAKFVVGPQARMGPIVAPLFLGVVLISMILAILGAFRIGTGLGHGFVTRLVFLLLMLVPLWRLIVLLVLSTNATKALTAAGYKVGLMGAGPKVA